MKVTRILIVFLAAALLFSASALADSVTIANPGFEAVGLRPTGYVPYIPGWNTGTGFPAEAVGTFFPGAGQYPGGIPEGNNVAYTKGPWISQVLPTTLQPGLVYTLLVDVGYRLDNSSGPFTGYTISLLAGNTMIASSSAGTPTPGNFITALASFTALAGDPLIGQTLQILLTVNRPYPYQINFDNVRLDASAIPDLQGPQTPASQVPEPGTLALIGTGLLGLIRRAYRR